MLINEVKALINSHKAKQIPPEKRTPKNRPRDSNKNPTMSIGEWLQTKKSPKLYNKMNHVSWGWSPNGKCYGWSHRAVAGFQKGDKVKKDTIGNDYDKEWKIETDEQAEMMAKKFSDGVS